MISIIIVNYNTADILRQCVESILKFEKNIISEIIIVDNFSNDTSKEVINTLKEKSLFIKALFLESKKSFSYANNRGYEISKSEYILILNPDIIFTESILSKLVTTLKNKKDIGAIGTLLIGQDENFQNNYFQRFPTILQFILFHSILAKFFFRFPSLINKYLENREININTSNLQYVEQIPCAFFLTSRKIFEEVNRMDENYVLFFEDVDLSYQIFKKYKLAIDPTTQVTHLGGASFKTKDNWWLYGRFIISMNYFFKKNYSKVRVALFKLITIINSYIVLIIEKLKDLFNKSDIYRVKKHKYFLKEI